jgi:RNA recognition motif-containing protein
VYDDVKVIRNPETQESKGFAFIDAPNSEEMNSIIRRFDRAPLEDRLLRANQAQPPKSRTSPQAAGLADPLQVKKQAKHQEWQQHGPNSQSVGYPIGWLRRETAVGSRRHCDGATSESREEQRG